jgi:flavin reductase (DIM6/NTAB) family NADH-FMN oxidoreductase RutF
VSTFEHPAFLVHSQSDLFFFRNIHWSLSVSETGSASESVSASLREKLTPILGRIPSGVFILVAGDGSGRTTGLLASWIQQASFEPAQVTVAVNKSRYLVDWLKHGSPVTINQVAKGENTLFKHFGKGFDPDVEAFTALECVQGVSGLPMLKAAMTSMEGEITGSMESGDHVIFLITLTNAVAHREVSEFEPFVHVRKNGFSY